MTLVLGAVAYDPKVVTIWAGFPSWLRGAALDLDVVLYSHYERQVVDLIAGRRHRLEHLGFPAAEAAAVSAPRTRNFM